MKKYFVLVISMIVMACFVGCKPTEEPVVEKPTISISQKTLAMSKNEQKKLTVSTTSTTPLTYTWTSDNTDIVTVKNGIVFSTDKLGSANVIVSAEGCEPDTCVVYVTNGAVLDSYEIGGFGIFGQPEYIKDMPTVKDTLRNGDEIECRLSLNHIYVWDNNITFVNGTGFSGKGYFFMAEIPVYFFDYQGETYYHYINNDDCLYFAQNDSVDAIVPETALGGKLISVENYGRFWKTLIEDTTLTEISDELAALYDESQVGTQMFQIDWSTEGQSYYLGNVVNGKIYDEYLEDGSVEVKYNFDIEWYDFVDEDRWYGLKCITEEVTDPETGQTGLYITGIPEPFDMLCIDKNYTNIEAGEEGTDTNSNVFRMNKAHNYIHADYAVKQVNSALDKLYRK